MIQLSSLKNKRVLAGGVLLVVLFGGVLWSRRSKPQTEVATFAARRGPLQITVLEGGSVEAKQALEVRSEIKGYQGTKILSIVEEGYLVTDDDVHKGKVLVDLDSSDLRQRITQQDIQYENALASFINAQQDYSIQTNQNQSDIKLAEQRAKFALMDLEKYMGDVATKELLAKVGLPYDLSTNFSSSADDPLSAVNIPGLIEGLTISTNSLKSEPTLTGFNRASTDSTEISPWPGLVSTNAPAAESSLQPLRNNPVSVLNEKPEISSLSLDFSEYVNETNRLGDGAAKQNLRKLEDDVLVAKTDLNVAKTKLEGTRRLFQKDFVTKTELDNDEISVTKNELRVKTADTALELFKKYEFAKAAEEALSKYEEALQSLDRTHKQAISRLAQAQARYRSAEGQFRIQDSQRKELYEQLEKCTIHATKPGLVIYGGSRNQRYYNSDDQIREGATVRERQPIITIPDMSQMAVSVKIPEAYIKKVQRGLKARVTVDAFPDQDLPGEVTKVGVLPDSQDRFMNPDLKVYVTTVTVDGTYEWLKPGMSAKVEIQVKQLDDVIYVPVQAISLSEGKYYCYLGKNSRPEKRQVEVGDFNDQFIVIKNGLREGEVVRLRSSEAPQMEEEPGRDESEPNSTPLLPAVSAKNGSDAGNRKHAAP